MMILGLDVASVTGWALVDDSKSSWPTRCGTIKTPKGLPALQRAEVLYAAVSQLVDIERPQVAAIEAPLQNVPKPRGKLGFLGEVDKQGGSQTLVLLNVLACAAWLALRNNDITVLPPVEPRTWRKAILGSGTAPKGMDSKHMKRLGMTRAKALGIVVHNLDEADAVGIAHWCAAQMRTGAGQVLAHGANAHGELPLEEAS